MIDQYNHEDSICTDFSKSYDCYLEKTAYEIIKTLMEPNSINGMISSAMIRTDLFNYILRILKEEYSELIKAVQKTSIVLQNGSKFIWNGSELGFRGTHLKYCFIFDEFNTGYLTFFAPYSTNVLFREYLVKDIHELAMDYPVPYSTDKMDWVEYSQYYSSFNT